MTDTGPWSMGFDAPSTLPGRYRVLLVEDNPGDVLLIREGLRDSGQFEIQHVGDLAAAFEQLSSDPFDAILLDLNLPDSHGLDTLAEVVSRTRIPVLVLTGLNDEASGLTAIRHGAQDYLVKGHVGDEILPRALRYAIERWRLQAAVSTPLIETAPVGLAVLDRDLRFLYANPALAAMDGLQPVAHLGQRIDRVVPEVGIGTVEALEGVATQGLTIREMEIGGHSGPSDEASTWLLSAQPLRDASGDTVGLTISVVDISERKRREKAFAALAEMRQQAQAIGESISFGIWIADTDGRMRYLSESFLDLIGMDMEAASGWGWMKALVPESVAAVQAEWRECLAADDQWNRELTVVGRDGLRYAILSRGNPVRDGSGQVSSWAGINLDITARKQADEFREAFTGILSHELGTPMTSIFAASTLLQRPGLPEAQRLDLVEDIGHEAERLRRLVEDLVVLAKAERGTIQIHTEPVLLQRIVARVCEQERVRCPDRPIDCTVDPNVPVARAEDACVAQVARGLLDNATKYSPPNSPITVIVDSDGGQPRVRILDRGPGVDPDEAAKLFGLFYRSERTARIAGSGIGLFVAQHLVESMGGTIWARPRDDGPGAEFGLKLQAAVEENA